MKEPHVSAPMPKKKPLADVAGTQKKLPGRPSSFTQEKGDAICAMIADGMSMRAACKIDGMPEARTVFRWLREHEEFCQHYARSVVERTEAFAEEIIDIADDSTGDYIEGENGPEVNQEAIQRAKLRVDARKWIASKLLPKKYGDKQEVELSGQVEHTHLTLEELKARITEARR